MKEIDTTKNSPANALVPVCQRGAESPSSGLKGRPLGECMKKMGECFLNFTANADENINRLVCICGEFLGATCALYNRLEGKLLCSVGQWHTPPDYQPLDQPQGHICYDVITQPDKSPFIVHNLQNSPYAKTDPNVAKYKLQTYVGLPVKFNNSSIGALCVVFQEDFSPTSEDIGFMEIIASAIAVEEDRRETQLAIKESNRRYRQICETVTDYIYTVYIKDGQPKETIHGPSCLTVTGYTPEELVSDPNLWIKMVPEEDKAAVLKHAALVLSGEVMPPIEHRIIKKDGTLCWVRNTVVSHFDNERKLLFYDGLIQDITERKKAEINLQKNQQELQTILDSASTMVFYKDRDNNMVRVNKSFAETMGMDKKQIEGKSCFELWPHEAEHYWSDDKEVMASVHPKTGIVESLVTSKGPIWVETEKIPYRDEKGEIAGVIGFTVDISGRKKAEDGLKQSEEEYRTLVNNVNIGVYRNTPDAEGRFLKVNPAMAKMFGYDSVEEMMQTKVVQLYQSPQDRAKFLGKIREKGFVRNEELKLKKKDGTPIWASLTAQINFGKNGEVQWIDGVIDDITERKHIQDELEESETRFRDIFDNSKDGILLADTETKQFVMSNRMIRKMLGYTEEEIENITVKDIHPQKDLPHVIDQFDKLLLGEISVASDLPVRRKDGSVFCVDITATVVTLVGRKYLMGSFRDITERKQARQDLELLNKELLKSNKRLKQFALRDQQTGLFNHRYLEEAIEAEFYRAKRYAHPLSVIMLDIDYFKSINEVYGHNFGDLVLKQLARQLKRTVRQYDIVIRFGGEEFMIVSPGTDRAQTLTLARRLLDAINLYNFGDEKQTVKLKLSLAVASYPEDKIARGMDLVALTDEILNKVKEYGGNKVYSALNIRKKTPAPLAKKKINGDVRFLKDKIDKLTKKTNQSLVEAVFAFAKTLDLKDHSTGEHVEKTVHYATELARSLSLPEEEIERIKQAAILHDLGKIGISEKILAKNSKLTKKEMEEVKRHPQIGVDVIRPIKFLHNIIPLVLYHHERWDGKGYPHGLKADEIPVGARVVAVADVFEALTSDRPYRKAYPEEEALAMIKKGSGTQFDPRMVDKFLQLMQKKK